MDYLIVVDMQNDFVSGPLGTPEARHIVPNVAGRVIAGIDRGETVLFTRDTHEADYLSTQEGRRLPVPHCIRDTPGWEIVGQLQPYARDRTVIDKPTFGSTALGELLRQRDEALRLREGQIGRITLIGLCTDICVISNALVLKAFLPEAELVVDASCCAGVTPERHRTALAALESCQVTVENR